MKNGYILMISIVILFLSVHSVQAAENEFGEIQAWCNGEKATVNDLDVKIGEPITITVRVTSRIDGYVDMKLKEPWTTKSFEVISGPSDTGEWLTEPKVYPGWTQEYTWILTPNGEWTQGRTPILVDVTFNKDSDTKMTLGMTVVSPTILDEHYIAPDKTVRKDEEAGDLPVSVPNDAPGFGIVGALVGVVVVMLRRTK
ncbi:MAG: sarcinarray family MAST domain-containing protein [ANME-2 cluster archaeon]|nr:sarcinarray family MAST domain-containing protein [ANME-2 cluster archaeon]